MKNYWLKESPMSGLGGRITEIGNKTESKPNIMDHDA
jgi:hypothetical protein